MNMDLSKVLESKIKYDNDLSNRYIDLDPYGYFIIKINLEEKKIILEHYIKRDMHSIQKQMNRLNVTRKIKKFVMKFSQA